MSNFRRFQVVGGCLTLSRLKDMSTISFDVTFNEPISLLQKLAEEVEYFDLLRL